MVFSRIFRGLEVGFVGKVSKWRNFFRYFVFEGVIVYGTRIVFSLRDFEVVTR